jgi:hypothetical protein
VRALTLHQPWAHLIATGRKTFETRSWSTTYRGPIAIHAGRTVDEEYALECGIDPAALTRGAIVAVARLVAIIPTEQAIRAIEQTMPAAQAAEELRHGDYSPGRFAWELMGVRPVPALRIGGQLGLWDVPPDAEIQLRMDAGLAGR